MKRSVVVGVTGASGVTYAIRLLEALSATGVDAHLSISDSAVPVFQEELKLSIDLKHFKQSMLRMDSEDLREDERLKRLRALSGISSEQSNVLSVALGEPGKIFYHHHADMMAPIASGSFPTDGMIICPCSNATLGAVASGVSNNLIHRAAEIHLKERRPLILVTRETPLSAICLDNMQKVTRAGAVILPASPGFYHRAVSIQDLIDFVVGRICDQLKIKNNLIDRWGLEVQ
jgi:flavin prenyltransferase